MHHPQKFAIGEMPKHCLHLTGLLCLFNLTLGKPFHRLVNGVNGILEEAKCDLSLQFPYVKIRHPAEVVMYYNITIIFVDDEMARIHSPLEAICYWPDLFKNLQRENACHSPFIHQHWLDVSQFSGTIHCCRSGVRMPSKGHLLLLQVF